jgi:hypothetical protein
MNAWELFIHAHHCTSSSCDVMECSNIKEIIAHAPSCRIGKVGGCKECKRYHGMISVHARICTDNACTVRNCAQTKERLRTRTLVTL